MLNWSLSSYFEVYRIYEINNFFITKNYVKTLVYKEVKLKFFTKYFERTLIGCSCRWLYLCQYYMSVVLSAARYHFWAFCSTNCIWIGEREKATKRLIKTTIFFLYTFYILVNICSKLLMEFYLFVHRINK